MAPGHLHDHDHEYAAGRAEGPIGAGSERRIVWAIVLTGGAMVAEAVGGLIAGSLALLADAGHMLADLGALVLAYAAIHLGRRRADAARTYGYARLEVLAAFVNGITLLALSAWILIEAALRLWSPVPVLSGPMLAVASLGLIVNLASVIALHQGAAENLNVQAALIHVLSDLAGSVATIFAALVIWFTGWSPVDPVLSAVIAVLVIRSG